MALTPEQEERLLELEGGVGTSDLTDYYGGFSEPVEPAPVERNESFLEDTVDLVQAGWNQGWADLFGGVELTSAEEWFQEGADEQMAQVSTKTLESMSNFGFADDKEMSAKGMGGIILQSLGQMGTFIIPGTAAGKVIAGGAKALSSLTKAEKVLRKARLANKNTKDIKHLEEQVSAANKRFDKMGAALGYGAVSGSQFYEQAADEAEDMIRGADGQELLDSDPLIQDYYSINLKKDMPAGEAWASAVEEYIGSKRIEVGSKNALLGFVTGGALSPVYSGMVKGTAAKTVASGGVKGLVAEAGQETVQEGGGATIIKDALPILGADINPWDRAAVGAVTGGVVGGALGGASGYVGKINEVQAENARILAGEAEAEAADVALREEQFNEATARDDSEIRIRMQEMEGTLNQLFPEAELIETPIEAPPLLDGETATLEDSTLPIQTNDVMQEANEANSVVLEGPTISDVDLLGSQLDDLKGGVSERKSNIAKDEQALIISEIKASREQIKVDRKQAVQFQRRINKAQKEGKFEERDLAQDKYDKVTNDIRTKSNKIDSLLIKKDKIATKEVERKDAVAVKEAGLKDAKAKAKVAVNEEKARVSKIVADNKQATKDSAEVKKAEKVEAARIKKEASEAKNKANPPKTEQAKKEAVEKEDEYGRAKVKAAVELNDSEKENFLTEIVNNPNATSKDVLNFSRKYLDGRTKQDKKAKAALYQLSVDMDSVDIKAANKKQAEQIDTKVDEAYEADVVAEHGDVMYEPEDHTFKTKELGETVELTAKQRTRYFQKNPAEMEEYNTRKKEVAADKKVDAKRAKAKDTAADKVKGATIEVEDQDGEVYSLTEPSNELYDAHLQDRMDKANKLKECLG